MNRVLRKLKTLKNININRCYAANLILSTPLVNTSKTLLSSTPRPASLYNGSRRCHLESYTDSFSETGDYERCHSEQSTRFQDNMLPIFFATSISNNFS